MKPSLDLLRSFLAVHRTGSITAAAELLALAQPTVTAQIKALEAGLGRPLFERRPRGVVPTVAGDDLARQIAEPLDALEAAVVARTPAGAAASSTVHLGGPADFLCDQVLPALAGLTGAGLRLRTTFGMPDDLVAALLAGRLDLAVSSTRPRRAGLAVTPLHDEEFLLVAGARWARRVERPEDLDDVPLVAYGPQAPILRRYWRTVFDARLTRVAGVVVADLRGVLAAVLAGAGASVLPAYLCGPPLADGRLRTLAEPPVPPLNTLYLAHRPAALGQSGVALAHARLLDHFQTASAAHPA
ncbi:HTH-type transcriptional regulator AbaB [Frankia sp. AiPs1]|uniref:LysR family transcriptional regulator n=1 Tax=Frankia sp. AiPa1 TaxID=573492 RepID=UPI00202AFFFC|nr:LysR family transcriptional regulator [Frankia sp. AiPa1]MCL9761686.1 LysR family transcriptional regulator [Frankia sp. AiPa1]